MMIVVGAWWVCGGVGDGELNQWSGLRVNEWRRERGGLRGRVLDAPLLWLRLASGYGWC